VYRTSELGTGPPINLRGVAIGNGLTKPSVQYGAYADYALQEGLISQGVSPAASRHFSLTLSSVH
jgi:carboxypeptidase C (cathepsin A)